MDYFYQKFRWLRPLKPRSPVKFKIQRKSKDCSSQSDSNTSESPTSPCSTATPSLIDKIVLGRGPLVVNFGDEEEEPIQFTESDFVTECIRWHNRLREMHCSPPLKLSYQLCITAQSWANHLAHTNTFYHQNSGKDIGENLYCRWSYVPGFDVSAEQVVKYWYREIRNYDFYDEPSLLHVKAAGHFTQLVWRNTTEIGVGKARSRCGKVIIVANYKPSGNVIGAFQDNVWPPLKEFDETDDDELSSRS